MYLVILLLLGTNIYISVVYKQDNNAIYIDAGWEKYSKKALNSYIEKDRLIIVNATAKWCITCQVNKKTTYQSEEFLKFVKENNIVLLQADWTSRDENVSKLLKSYNRYSIPFDIVYGPNNKQGVIMNTILSPSEIKYTVDSIK